MTERRLNPVKAMDAPPPLPPVARPVRSITYELSRWDLFVSWLTIFLRNRMIQVFVAVAIFVNMVMVLGPRIRSRPLLLTAVEAAGVVAVFLTGLAACQTLMGLASSFIGRQRGVVGEHTLEITEQGLVERTAFNEALHKWPSVSRVLSLCGHLYIYVGDTNFHQVPMSRVPAQELRDFEAELRARARPER